MAITITKPTVGGSTGTWGTELNTALDTIVAGVNAAQTAADTGGAGIPATTINSRGDLIVANSTGAATRQAVGSNGQVLTADNTYNTGVAWKAAPGTLVAKFTQTSTQNFPSGADQFVTWQVDYTNPAFNGMSSGTGSYNPGTAGWYELTGSVAWVNNATGLRMCYWLSGSAIAGSASTVTPVNGLATCNIAKPTVVQLSASGAVALYAYQTSGSALSTASTGQYASTMTVKWLGP